MQVRVFSPIRRPSRTFLLSQHLNCSRRFSACSCDNIEPTVPPAPGTVKEYEHHVLIKLPRPADASATAAGSWWPDHVERHPIMLGVFRTLALHRATAGSDAITVKVTAYDDLGSSSLSTNKDTCDLAIFPASLRYNSLPIDFVDAAVAYSLGIEPPPAAFSGQKSANGSNNLLPPAAKALEQDISTKILLFVCCHGSRDARCSHLGTPLAKELLRLVKERGLQDRIEVFATSHIGGHKYAGNVVVYGALHPSDGDWFGGLRAEHAEAFLDALVEVEVGVDGGAEDPRLRQWWRGRMGLNKEQQLQLWEAQGLVEVAELVEESEGEGVEEEDVDIAAEDIVHRDGSKEGGAAN